MPAMGAINGQIEFTKQPYAEDVGPRKIKSIKFSMFSGSEISKAAEVQVWRSGHYDKQRLPIENGLLDPRMGPSKNGTCATCYGDYDTCPGHFGYLNLVLPVFNIGYIRAIIDILKCICKSCARILLLDKDRRTDLMRMRNPKMEVLQKKNLVKQVIKKCRPATCSRCGYVNGVVKKGESAMWIVHDDRGLKGECSSAATHTKESRASFEVVNVLNPVKVLSLFKRMLDEDCELLYLCDRPEKLILTDIPVPPNAIRPSVFMEGGMNSNEDDATTRLKYVILANASLRQELQSTSFTSKLLGNWEFLQAEVALYINSDARGIPLNLPSGTSHMRGFIQRLKGKQGRFRSNLSGKRVQFTGRTVISPDPNLKITEVGVPILMALKLTYPEVVSCHNIEKLKQRVCNGPQKYPGANFIIYPDGTMVHLRYSKREYEANDLKDGYIVERHLEDGDIVLFNRQPSLHRMSVMAHRARVMPWRTLRFNESVCNPYNADFDGDEMNLHVPQTEEARTEALLLMGVQNNLCTPKNGEILVASTQDFLTSSFLITRKDTFYDRSAFSLLCSYMGDAIDSVDLPTPAIIKPIELWTGKQLFGVLVRPHGNMRVYVNLALREKSYIKGETMCPNDGYVYFRNSELISGQLGKATLGSGNKNGLYSVLLRDYNVHAAAACMNRVAKLSARWIGNHGFSIGVDDVQPREHLKRQTDAAIKGVLSSVENMTSNFRPPFDHDALEANIAHDLINIRNGNGKVCMKELHWRNSPLIMSQCGSKGSPDNICQMIACVGQQIVSGSRAAYGFIDRCLPHFPRKTNEPAGKGFVANSFYDGLTPTEFFFHTMGGREGLVDTAVKTADTGYLSRKLIKSLEDLSVLYDNTVRTSSGAVVQFTYGDDGMDPSKMEGKNGFPLNLERLYLKVKATCPPREHATLSLSNVSEFLKKIIEGRCSEKFEESLRDFCYKLVSTSNNTMRADMYGVTENQIKVFLETCISRYDLKKLEAGTAIGAIGAQSIGEPGTQMTLKTFHFAGVGNLTSGVPRLMEIVNAAKNIATPVITAILDEDYNNAISVEMVKTCVLRTTLEDVAKKIAIVTTERESFVYVKLDMEKIRIKNLGISASSVRKSILSHPRTKLKPQHIEALGDNKLKIHSPERDRSQLQFELNSLLTILLKVIVKGVPTVECAAVKEENGKYQLDVKGTNLRAVMVTPGVDGCQIRCNHFMEVKETLGIEAARQCIINQIKETMEEMRIDIRHMMLLADTMTSTGEVLAINRFGIQKMKESVLMNASFEKSADHLFDAAVNGRDDKIEGVSECIIMGIPVGLGTGMLKVRQRVEQMPKLKYGMDPIIS